MKLWWPHSEAMIAFLMGYSDSGDPALLHLFFQVAEYTFRQVSAASWSTALCGLSGDLEEIVSHHSAAGCPGLQEEAGQGWGGSTCSPFFHHTGHGPSAGLGVPGGLGPGTLCSFNKVPPASLDLTSVVGVGGRL